MNTDIAVGVTQSRRGPRQPQSRTIVPRELDTERDPADDDPEEPNGAEKESDRQEHLSIAAARLSNEESADEGGEQPSNSM